MAARASFQNRRKTFARGRREIGYTRLGAVEGEGAVGSCALREETANAAGAAEKETRRSDKSLIVVGGSSDGGGDSGGTPPGGTRNARERGGTGRARARARDRGSGKMTIKTPG